MSSRKSLALSAVLSSALLLLAACGGGAVNPTATTAAATNPNKVISVNGLPGVLHGGQAPIIGSTVTLYAAGVPVGTAPTTLGTTTTDASGNFNFAGFQCAAPDALMYVVANGGNAGGGNNPAIKLMAALGVCSSVPGFIVINELTTVAAVYALNAFSIVQPTSGGGLGGCVDCVPGTQADMTQLHGNAPAIGNAFKTAALLADIATGQPSLFLPPAGSCLATIPSQPVNCDALQHLTALGNSLASCVNSTSGSTQCTQLFQCAQPGAIGTACNVQNPNASSTNTLQATYSIARSPGLVSIAGVYFLASPNVVFSPGLATAPNEWTIALNFPSGGFNTPSGIAIDGSGNVWVTNITGNSLTELDSTGTPLSGPGGFMIHGLAFPGPIAIDASGLVYVVNTRGGGVTAYDPKGIALTLASFSHASSVAVDPSGNVWVNDSANNNVTDLLGTVFTQGGLSRPSAIAFDPKGHMWIINAILGSRGTTARTFVVELDTDGKPLSPPGGFTASVRPQAGDNFTEGMAIDPAGNVWLSNFGGPSELDPSGNLRSPVFGFPGLGGLLSADGIAVDSAGHAWTTNFSGVQEYDPTGLLRSPASGFNAGGYRRALGIAIDGAGDIWVTNSTVNAGDSITEFVGLAASTITPIVSQIIDAATVVSIAVTPVAGELLKGTSQQFTATASYSDAATGNVTSAASWTSSNPAIATVTNSGGLVTCVTSGQVTITASFRLQNGSTGSGSTTLTCLVPVITLVSIAVTPNGGITVTAPGTEQFAVTGAYSDGSQNAITSGVAWSVGGSAVATISTTGLAQCVGAGEVTVTATVARIAQATAALTCQVSGPTLTGFALAPLSASIPVGGTQQFTVTGTFSDASTADITSLFSWTSSNTTLATVRSPGGLATGVLAGGPITITGTLLSTGATVSAQLTVTAAAAGLTCLPAPSPQGGGAQVYDNQSFCVQLAGTTDLGTTFGGTLTFTTPLAPGPIIGCQYLVSLSPAGTAPTACTGTTDASGNLSIVDAVNEANTNTKFVGIFAPSAIDTVTGSWSSENFAAAGGAVVTGTFSGTQQ